MATAPIYVILITNQITRQLHNRLPFCMKGAWLRNVNTRSGAYSNVQASAVGLNNYGGLTVITASWSDKDLFVNSPLNCSYRCTAA